MKIIFFIMYYIMMYIGISLEKEIDMMKNRRFQMTFHLGNIYMKSLLKNSEFEDLLKLVTTLNNLDLTVRIIIFDINDMDNVLVNSFKDKKVLIRLKYQVIGYNPSTIDERIIHCGSDAADDNLYVNSNGNFAYVYLQIDIPRSPYFNLRLCTSFDSADVTRKIEKTGQQRRNREIDNSEKNENSNMPIQYRLGRNLQSVIIPRTFKKRLERFQSDDSLRTYHYVDSKKRKVFFSSVRPNFNKGKYEYYSSSTFRSIVQRRAVLFDKGNGKKQYFSSVREANLRRNNGIEIRNNSDVKEEATAYIDTILLLSTFTTTRKYYISHLSDMLSSNVKESTTLPSLDIYKYVSSTIDNNYYVDYNLKADQRDYDEYVYGYEEPMEDTARWYDYFVDNNTFTTISTRIDPVKLHTETTMFLAKHTDFILTSRTNYFDVASKIDSSVPTTLLALIERTEAMTLIEDTLSSAITVIEYDETFTIVEPTTTESTTEYIIGIITRQSYASEMDDEKVKIITKPTIVLTTANLVNNQVSSSMIVEQATTVSGDLAESLLLEETGKMITREIIDTKTQSSRKFERSTITEPSLVFTFSVLENAPDVQFVTEIQRKEKNENEMIIVDTFTSTEIVTSSYITTHGEMIKTKVSYFANSTDTSTVTIIIIEDEREKTALRMFTSSSLEGTMLSMSEEIIENVKLEKPQFASTIVSEMSQVEENTDAYIPEIIYGTTVATYKTIKVESSARTIAIENIFATIATFIPEIIETEGEVRIVTSVKTDAAFTVTPKEIKMNENVTAITTEKLRTALTIIIPEITPAGERISVITLAKIDAGFNITSKISKIEESNGTNISEITYAEVTVASNVIGKNKNSGTITIEQFLTTFTAIHKISFVEEILETSIIDMVTPISSEIISIVDEWSRIITNRTILSPITVTINQTAKIVKQLTEIENKLASTSAETSLTLTFTMATEPSSTTIDYEIIDIAFSPIFMKTAIPSSEIIFIPSVSAYDDTYKHTIVFPETFGVSERESYFLTTSERFITPDIDRTSFQISTDALSLSSSIVPADFVTVIKKVPQSESVSTLSTLIELSLSIHGTSVTPLQEIYSPTLLYSTYFKMEAEETRMSTDTTEKVVTIQQSFTFVNFKKDITTLSTTEKFGLSSSIFIYPITLVDVEEKTRMLKITTNEIVLPPFTFTFFPSETITSSSSDIAIFVSNFMDVYCTKETTTLPTDSPILLTLSSRNVLLTFFPEMEYPSTFIQFLTTATVLTGDMFESLTRSTLIDRRGLVVSPKSPETKSTGKITTKTKIEDYEEPEKFYDTEYGEDFREAYEDGEYMDINETVTKWYDYVEEEEKEETIKFVQKITLETSKFIEKEGTLTFSTRFIMRNATITSLSSENSAGTSFEIETTATTVQRAIASTSFSETLKITYITVDVSLTETYRTSYKMKRTTMIGEQETSTTLFTSAFETPKGFEILTTETISSASLYNIIEEWYTLTTGKILIYTTDHLEWWIDERFSKISDYTSPKFELHDEKTTMYITLPKFFTLPDETLMNIGTKLTGLYKKLELNASQLTYDLTSENENTIYMTEIATTPLLLFTESWCFKETSKVNIIMENEALFDSTVTGRHTDFKRTTTSLIKYINEMVEEEIISTTPGGRSSLFFMDVETTTFELHSTNFLDLVTSLVADILDKTCGKTDQEEKLKTLMDEIKRTEHREKEIKQKKEEQDMIEGDFERRKKWKEIEKKGKKGDTSFFDITRITTCFIHDETTVSGSIELLSIDDILMTYASVALQFIKTITTEPTIFDSSPRKQALEQEVERLKEELRKRQDKLEEWERQLQEKKERFEKEKKEYEENLRRKFKEKTGQEITSLTTTTGQSVFTSSSSATTDCASTVRKLYLLSTISLAETLMIGSGTFKPPVESELFTPAPPTERTTSTSRYLHRVNIACTKSEKRERTFSLH